MRETLSIIFWKQKVFTKHYYVLVSYWGMRYIFIDTAKHLLRLIEEEKPHA